jgi:hypothetical protein
MAEKWCFDRHNEVRKINLGRGTSKFTRVQRAYKRRQTLNLGTKQLIRPLLFGRGCLLVHGIMRKKCASEEASHSASTTKVQIDNPTHLCATDAHPMYAGPLTSRDRGANRQPCPFVRHRCTLMHARPLTFWDRGANSCAGLGISLSR